MQFIGHAGSGFNAETHKELAGKFEKLVSGECPFEKIPETNEKASWVLPKLVAKVRFTGWTQEKRLRHPVYLGLRDDKKAEECTLQQVTENSA